MAKTLWRRREPKCQFFLFVLFKILYVTWSSSAFSSAAKTLSDDGLLRWEKRMTSVCGHLHLSSSYPEIYGCSHTTVIISSSGVISQAAKWSWVATYVNTAKLVFLQPKFSDAWYDEDITTVGTFSVVLRKNPPLCDNSQFSRCCCYTRARFMSLPWFGLTA